LERLAEAISMSQLIPREKFENLKHFFGVTKPLALFKVDPDKY